MLAFSRARGTCVLTCLRALVLGVLACLRVWYARVLGVIPCLNDRVPMESFLIISFNCALLINFCL